MTIWPLGFRLDDGALDKARAEPARILRVEGWAAGPPPRVRLRPAAEALALSPTLALKTCRPDVARDHEGLDSWCGVALEWRRPPPLADGAALVLPDGRQAPLPPGARAVLNGPDLPYAGLLDDPAPWGRDQLYGQGPPDPGVASDFIDLARKLTPPVLDVGCGAGPLVAALRAAGVDAYGVELDQPRIREALLPEARPYVTLIDPDRPLPFADKTFGGVLAFEVLEHVPDWRRLVTEMLRLARRAVAVSVPDMSAVPRGHPHGAVPWHILDSDHVHFFTPPALAAPFRAQGCALEWRALNAERLEGGVWPGSLGLLARLPG